MVIGGRDRVKRSYDAVAALYHEQLDTELDGRPLDPALLRAFVEHVGVGTIAEVGCGPGHVTRFLTDVHGQVRAAFAVDLPPGLGGIRIGTQPRE